MRGSRLVRLWALLGLLIIAMAATASLATAECTTSFLRKFGGEPSDAGELSNPRDIAIDSKGNTWVADSAHSRVQEFNASGEFVTQFGAGEGFIYGIDLDSEGNIWVVKFSTVSKYKANGELILSFGSSGTGNGQFKLAQGIAVDSSGNAYVVDAGLFSGVPRVQKFNSKGEYLSQFGKEGTGDGEFKIPQAIAVDSEGNILVADTGNNRVQKFNSAGEFLGRYGVEGTGNGQFKSPSGIAVDSEGKVWVTDSGNNRIERFSAEGEYLSQFGSKGSGNGQFSEAHGIAVSGSNIWVADSGNNRVQELSCL